VVTPNLLAIFASQSPHWTVYDVAAPDPPAGGVDAASAVAETGTDGRTIGCEDVGGRVGGRTIGPDASDVPALVTTAVAARVGRTTPSLVVGGGVPACTTTALVGAGSVTGGFSRVHAAALANNE